jgi:ParB family chromosome partitioning protein
MAKKSGGLGRGLDALFSESTVLKDINKNNEEETVKNIKLIDIEPNTTQARKTFKEESINELANSIKNYGVLQPIIVENKGKYYRIIAGERRWRAAKKAGLETIPCLIRDEDEQKNKEISLIENIQRENLNPIEKALGYKELIDNYNLKQQDLADKLGISRPYVANTLRILNLDERVIKLALDGKLTEGHCKTLVSIQDPDKQYEMALKIVENGGTVGDTERMVKNEKKVPKKNKEYLAACRDIEDSFQRFFGTKVKLNAGPRSGKIIIQYSTNDELERILGIVRKEI